MTLIDPQSHRCADLTCLLLATNISSMEPNALARIEWDAGPKHLKAFIEHHLEEDHCDLNHFCNVMGLREMQFTYTPKEGPSTPPQKTTRARSVTHSPEEARAKKRTRPEDQPYRHGSLITVEDFLSHS